VNFLPLVLTIVAIGVGEMELWPSAVARGLFGSLCLSVFFGVSIYIILRKNLHKALIILVFLPCTAIFMYLVLLFLAPREKAGDVLWPKLVISFAVGGVVMTGLTALELFLKDPHDEQIIAQGKEFGKKSDQQGCIDEGLSRLKDISPTFSHVPELAEGSVFVEACLKASRSTPGFCDDVPAWWKLKQLEYEDEQCRKLGLAPGGGCKTVFGEKWDFCQW
jgi:hypothetical protein